MTTTPLFQHSPYMRNANGLVVDLTDEGGIILDEAIFYATSGGQPGDSGRLVWDEGAIAIRTTVKGPSGTIVLVPAEPAVLPRINTPVHQILDWDRRYRLMRMHTALHLLSVVIPLPVTGGSIGEDKGRLDFEMPEAPHDPAEIEAELNALIARDLVVTEEWITEAELDDNPGLVKTLSVQPPRGVGRIRLIRISDSSGTVDLQPCGGTHVSRTAEIGPVTLGKIEKKGRQSRRVIVLLS